MRTFLLITITVLLLGAGIGASLACGQDIFCPAGWMWSDEEGTCTEAPLPTVGPPLAT